MKILNHTISIKFLIASFIVIIFFSTTLIFATLYFFKNKEVTYLQDLLNKHSGKTETAKSPQDFNFVKRNEENILNSLGYPEKVQEQTCFNSQYFSNFELSINLLLQKDNLQVYSLNCPGGAYNPANEYFLVKTIPDGSKQSIKQYTKINIDDKELIDGKIQDYKSNMLFGLEKFDTETKTLSIWYKCRGLGDCGSYKVYKLSEDLKELKLIEFRNRDLEDFEVSEEQSRLNTNFDNWDIIYKAQ